MFMTHVTELSLYKKLISACITLLVAFVATSPFSANAATFQPYTQGELVAYMFGIVDTLQAQLDAQNGTVSGGGSSRVSTSNATIAVETKVTLRAEFTATNNNTVYAWFEYGEDSRLTSKTTRIKATGTGTVRAHARTITGLQSGTTYSYRPVFEVSGGTKYYGAVRTFSTGATGTVLPGSGIGNGDTNSGSSVSTSRGSMAVDKTTYEAYDTIEVDWTVPSSRRDNGNWIGLFEVGDDNREYQSWQYLRDSSSGTVTFTAPGAGSYEFRLFYDDSYDDELTSRRITVTN